MVYKQLTRANPKSWIRQRSLEETQTKPETPLGCNTKMWRVSELPRDQQHPSPLSVAENGARSCAHTIKQGPAQFSPHGKGRTHPPRHDGA